MTLLLSCVSRGSCATLMFKGSIQKSTYLLLDDKRKPFFLFLNFFKHNIYLEILFLITRLFKKQVVSELFEDSEAL